MEPAAPVASATPPRQDPKRLVLKNTAILMLGQMIGTPLSMLVVVVMARYLGPEYYGLIYIGQAMTTLGFLFVDWGQGSVIAGEIARDRSKGGVLLGTSLVWRLFASLVVYAILAAWTALEKNAPDFQMILFLLTAQAVIYSLTTVTLEAIRGLERTDISAYQNVLQPLLRLAIVVPVLAIFHAGVRGALLAQLVVMALMLIYVWRARAQVGIKPLRFSTQTLKSLFPAGSSFLVFHLAMSLQPTIDAKMLQYLDVPMAVVGWNATARQLVGNLILPAAVLIGALYPTLSRLHVEDRAAFVSTLRSALHGTLILAFPIGLSCALFADLGPLLFGAKKYGGAQANLVLMAPFVFLVYLSMPLGSAIMAAQKHRVWGLVQFICVLVSLVLDPLLIPWFQEHHGNGGLGVCVAAVVSEICVVACGMWLTEKGTFDRSLLVALLRCLAAGVAMAAVALAFRRFSISIFLAAPVALVSYGVALWAVGGLKGEQMNQVRDTIRRKLRR